MKIYFCVLLFILGACFGSFSNVLIYRLPKKISLLSPPSSCTVCNNKIKPYDNIPILSYIILGGKCRFCGSKISPRYIVVETISAIVYLIFALLFYNANILLAIIYSLSFSALLVISFIDFQEMEISTSMCVGLLIFGVILLVFDSSITWYSRLIGFAVGGGILLFIYGVGYLVKHKEVLGLGDVKLLALGGLLVGWKAIIVALFIAVVLGSIILLAIQGKINKENKEIPFAPFLSFGIVVSMFVGNPLMDLYIGLFQD